MKNNSAERHLRAWMDMNGKMNMNQVCPGSPKDQFCLGVHQAQHCQLVKGGDYPTLLCTGVASP